MNQVTVSQPAAVPRAFRAGSAVTLARGAVAVAALILGLGAVGSYRGWEASHDLWPVPDQAMTFRYFGAYLSAFAAALGWVALTGELAALASVAITVMAGSVGLGLFFLLSAGGADTGPYLANAAAFGVLLVASLALFRWARALPEHQAQPQPRGVRWSFLLFIALLILAGGLSVTRTAQILPWSMTPAWQTIVGMLLLSSALFFTYGYRRGTWAQAGAQLAGFLIYDLVLALPYGRLVFARDEPPPSRAATAHQATRFPSPRWRSWLR